MKMFAAILFLAFAGVVMSPASAHYREACWVKVSFDGHSRARSRGSPHVFESPVFAVQCNYLSGQELNVRHRQRIFDEDRVYVVIAWPDSEPNYIRLSQSLFFCSPVAEKGCAERISGTLSGYDHGYDWYGRAIRRTWQICQPGFIGRNCYRTLQ